MRRPVTPRRAAAQLITTEVVRSGYLPAKTVKAPHAFLERDFGFEAEQRTDPGKVRHVRSYALKPGMAKVYNEGDLHSPRRDGPTRLIRLEGRNMDRVKRLAYEKVGP